MKLTPAALALALAAGAGWGQLSSESLAWDCWVGQAKTVNIYCIRDRDGRAALSVADTEDDPGELLLEEIHAAIHRGDFDRADRLATANPRVFPRGSLWVIPIYSWPHRDSWTEGRPSRVVRAALCRRGEPCTVFLPERR